MRIKTPTPFDRILAARRRAAFDAADDKALWGSQQAIQKEQAMMTTVDQPDPNMEDRDRIETPRTDNFAHPENREPMVEWVGASFARQLERELNEANKNAAAWAKDANDADQRLLAERESLEAVTRERQLMMEEVIALQEEGHKDRAEIETLSGEVLDANRSVGELKNALANLHAMVLGECPSILRDDHLDSEIRKLLSPT